MSGLPIQLQQQRSLVGARVGLHADCIGFMGRYAGLAGGDSHGSCLKVFPHINP